MAIGREAIRNGYSVLFTPAMSLITALMKGQAEGRLEDKLIRYAKPKLLIIDELGYLPLEPQAAHLFFGKRPTLTPYLPPHSRLDMLNQLSPVWIPTKAATHSDLIAAG